MSKTNQVPAIEKVEGPVSESADVHIDADVDVDIDPAGAWRELAHPITALTNDESVASPTSNITGGQHARTRQLQCGRLVCYAQCRRPRHVGA